MNEYDLCKWIKSRIANKAAEVFSYNWSVESCVNEIRELPGIIINTEGFFRIDPTVLTKDEMTGLGFSLWSEESPMMLLPLWLLPFLVDEVKVGSVSGGDYSVVRRVNMDNDHRWGYLAYGVKPSDVD